MKQENALPCFNSLKSHSSGVKEQNAALHQILHYKNKNHINDLHLGELVGLSDDYSKSWIMYSEDKSLNPGDFVSKNGHLIGVIDQHDGHYYTIAGIMNSNENVAVTHRKSHQSYLLEVMGITRITPIRVR